MADLDLAVVPLKVPVRMRESKILVVGHATGTEPARSAEQIKEKLGTELITLTPEQVIAAHEAIDPQAAEAEAEAYWLTPAKGIVEPSRAEVVNRRGCSWPPRT